MPATLLLPSTARGVQEGADWLRQHPELFEVARHLEQFPLTGDRLLGALAGEAHDSGARPRLVALCERGLASRLEVPLPLRPRPYIYRLTDLGLAVVGRACGQDPATIAARYDGTPDRILAGLAGLAPTIAFHGALATYLRTGRGRPTVTRLETDWIPRGEGRTGEGIPVRLAAEVDVTWRDVADDGAIVQSDATAILLPDMPRWPTAHSEAGLAGQVARWSEALADPAGPQVPPVVIVVGDDEARRAEWRAILDRVPAPYAPVGIGCSGVACPIILVETRDRPLRRGHLPRPSPPPLAPDPLTRPTVPGVPVVGVRGRAARPRPIADASFSAALSTAPALSLWPPHWTVLEAIAEYPLRRDTLLAEDVGLELADLRWVLAELALLGLLRRLDARDSREEFRSVGDRESAEMVCASHLPVEVTAVGLDALAARAGLSPAALVQLQGYTGGGPGRAADGRPLAFGERAYYAADYRRTDDLYRLRADLYRQARSHPHDRALCLLRPAGLAQVSCPHMVIGYVRRGVEYRAYVEYGRAPRGEAYYQRMVAGYRAHAAGTPTLAPPILFLSLTRRNARDLADMLRRILGVPGGEAAGRPILLTTLDRAFDDPDGILGPIWRTPWSDEPVWWIPPTRLEDTATLRGWEDF